MLKEADRFLSSLSDIQLGLFSFFLVANIGIIDFASGYELSFSIFYTIPVAIVSWYSRKRLSYLFCIISALTWFAADYHAGHQYSHPSILLWNVIVHLGFFIIFAFLLNRLHDVLASQKVLAQLDGLTGMMNARAFRLRCNATFDLALRHNRSLALGYLDLDGFKGINDTLGHDAGDLVLKTVANAITRRLRTSDFGGRLGGDEFAIVLPETDLAGARAFFDGLRSNLIEQVALNNWPVGFSFGVAVFRFPAANPDEAIRYADALMYKVKNSGKNRILYEEFSGSAGKV